VGANNICRSPLTAKVEPVSAEHALREKLLWFNVSEEEFMSEINTLQRQRAGIKEIIENARK